MRRDPGDVEDWNGARIRMAYNPAVAPPLGEKKQFIITWKGSVLQEFYGFLQQYSPAEAVLSTRTEVECVISIDGDVVHSDESS